MASGRRHFQIIICYHKKAVSCLALKGNITSPTARLVTDARGTQRSDAQLVYKSRPVATAVPLLAVGLAFPSAHVVLQRASTRNYITSTGTATTANLIIHYTSNIVRHHGMEVWRSLPSALIDHPTTASVYRSKIRTLSRNVTTPTRPHRAAGPASPPAAWFYRYLRG